MIHKTTFPLSIVTLTVILLFNSCSKHSGKDRIQASGIIEAVEIRLASKASGQIMQLRFPEGSDIQSGDTLATIDHLALDYQLKAAQAAVDAAKAQYSMMKDGARKEDLISAQETLNTADVNCQAAKADFERINNLYASGSASEKTLQDAHTRLAAAEAQANTAAENLKKLQKIFRPQELDAALALLNQAQANRDLIQQKIADCHITAPLSGAVVNLPFETGETVAAGMIIAKIANSGQVEMMIYVPENQIGKILLGQTAKVSIDSYPKRDFLGKVVYISPEAEFTPKNIQTKEDRVKLVFGVKLVIDNKDLILKSGMPADAEIDF